MIRSSFVMMGILFFSTICFAQPEQDDSQTIRAILSEVRQLRQELQVTGVAVQRTQILLYRLQWQEAFVARTSQHLDEVRETLAGTQSERKHLAEEIKEHELFIANSENPATQRKVFEGRLPEDKARLESSESTERQQLATEQEVERQLRAEEEKLDDFRNQLDRFDHELENLGRKLGGDQK
jgi:hypothetical protein